MGYGLGFRGRPPCETGVCIVSWVNLMSLGVVLHISVSITMDCTTLVMQDKTSSFKFCNH